MSEQKVTRNDLTDLIGKINRLLANIDRRLDKIEKTLDLPLNFEALEIFDPDDIKDERDYIASDYTKRQSTE